MPSLGNIGASALVKSAASIASQIADYQDKMAALQWNSSAQTDADYTEYSKYLTVRITKLENAGSLSTASKALTLTSTLQSANRSYVSNSIQRSSIAILDGSGTSIDKQNAIVGFYQQAVENGDSNLAQNLLQQYYSLNQQIQYEADVAARASADLAKVNSKAQRQGYSDAIAALDDKLAAIGADLKTGGQGVITQALKNFAKENKDLFKQLGVVLPEGAAANNGSIIAGVLDAKARLHGLAADVVMGTDPAAFATESRAVENILNNVSGVNVGGAKFTLEDAQFYAENPDAYYQKTTGVDIQGRPTYALAQAAVVDYRYDAQGRVIPVYSESGEGNLADDEEGRKQAKKDLEAAGFSVEIGSNGEIQVTQSTDGKNAFFNKVLDQNGVAKNTQFVVTKTSTGYQFAPVINSSGTSRLFTLAKDDSGKFGLYSRDFDAATGTQRYSLLSKFDNYDTVRNTIATGDTGSSVAGALQSAFANYSTMPQGYTESTIIPDIANKYFNGDKAAAAQAVYNFRKPLEYAQNNPGAPSVGGIAPKPTAGQPIAPIPQATKQILSTPKINVGNTVQPQINTAINSGLDKALKQSFSGFSVRPSGYTENVILKQIAGQFFNGDIKAASDPVYKYRKTNFGQ